MALRIESAEPGTAVPLFEDFLRGQGTCEQTTETAIKRVLAYQLAAAMQEHHISKVEMAKRLATSRSQLDRLLDPDNDTATLATLAKAAHALGRTIKLELRKGSGGNATAHSREEDWRSRR